jgi:hypothetical protein
MHFDDLRRITASMAALTILRAAGRQGIAAAKSGKCSCGVGFVDAI